jgi:DinB superfamily
LSGAQWDFKPAPDRWSIAECVEHIALAEDYYFELIRTKVLASPAQPRNSDAPRNDEVVLAMMGDRMSKRVAFQNLTPLGHWSTPQAAIEHFNHSRARLIDYTRTTNDELRDHLEAHRAAGLIDAFQWILLASGHVRRHTDQILEVKTEPRF